MMVLLKLLLHKDAQSQVKNQDALSSTYFDRFANVINKTFTGFKAISKSNVSLTDAPTITNLTSSSDQNLYLPS